LGMQIDVEEYFETASNSCRVNDGSVAADDAGGFESLHSA
jgi:hypothetical protein